MGNFMKRLMPILLSLFIFGCLNRQEKQLTTVSGMNFHTEKSEINYKAKTYKLFVGQTKDSVKKIIDIQRDLEQDNSFNETDSIQHYMYIGEDLIRMTNPDTTDVLPALYFTFLNGRLKDFVCSIVFEPEEKNEKIIGNYLAELKPFFNKLAVDSNKKILSKKLLLEFNGGKAVEKFLIDTTGRTSDLLFTYKIEAK